MAADPLAFVLPMSAYGVPSRDQLVDLRIWDGHYHGFNQTDNDQAHFAAMFYVERMGIERVIALDLGGTRTEAFVETEFDRRKREILAEYPEKVSGIIRIDPSDPVASCRKMEKWIRRGPAIGIKYSGEATNRDGIKCSHPNNDPIIQLARELNAVVYIHTWMKVGGNPRMPGGGNNPGDSSPEDVAILARRFPDVPLICGHSGGDWELGARAVRSHENVLFEFSGSDPHSGQVDYAIAELGADRIVWGGHGPSRSYATELGKVLDAAISHRDRMKVFGENYRRIAARIFRAKGIPLNV